MATNTRKYVSLQSCHHQQRSCPPEASTRKSNWHTRKRREPLTKTECQPTTTTHWLRTILTVGVELATQPGIAVQELRSPYNLIRIATGATHATTQPLWHPSHRTGGVANSLPPDRHSSSWYWVSVSRCVLAWQRVASRICVYTFGRFSPKWAD